MSGLLSFLYLIIGFYLLIKGAELLIKGSSNLSTRLGIPLMVVGLTVVAFGTSAPELVVNVIASLNGESNFAMGNIIGSNISNLLLVLGCTAIIANIRFNSMVLKIDMSFNFFALFFLFFIILFPFSSDLIMINQLEGFVLLILFFIYQIFVFKNKKLYVQQEENIGTLLNTSITRDILFIIIGLAVLVFGGRLVVNGGSQIALELANYFNLQNADSLVGLTIVAIGTSLPELITCVVAAKKGMQDLAIGNIFGSNLFNILWVLGISAFISPLRVSDDFIQDISVLLLANIAMLLSIILGKPRVLRRSSGWFLVIGYFCYNLFLVYRTTGHL